MTTAVAEVDSRALARLLRTHLRPHRKSAGTIVVLQVLQAVALLYLPTLNADIIDNAVVKGDTDLIVRDGVVMIVVALLQGVATIVAVQLSARTAMAVGRDIRAALFQAVQRFSAPEMERIGIPSLITRTSNDVQQVQMLLLSALTLVVTAPVMAIGGVAMALVQDVALSIHMVVLIVVLGAIVAGLISRMRPLSKAVQTRIDTLNQVLREQITGVRVTRAFLKQQDERDRFARGNRELTEVSTRLGQLNTMLLPLVVNTVNVFGVVAVWIGGYRVAVGAIEIGALTAFLTYLVMVQTALLSALFVVMNLPRAEVCAGRIEEVLLTEPSIGQPAAPVARFPAPGQVELRDVHFRYPGAEEDVLLGVSLRAGPGSTTAVVGSTGSGKSTLVALLCRQFETTGGKISVGGVDLRSLDQELLSQTVGVVPQRPFLFSGTIASNLRYGRPDATDDEMWRVLEIAQARQFVEHMEGGLSAQVAPSGANLSGGQRQRLAIARTLVRRPQIYLFDDSFSALDYQTDALLREALIPETSDATVIVVAQRVRTIMDADQIVVLDEGAVSSIGTHRDLIQHNEVYRQIVQSQLDEELGA